jgi:hypothetical protein
MARNIAGLPLPTASAACFKLYAIPLRLVQFRFLQSIQRNTIGKIL